MRDAAEQVEAIVGPLSFLLVAGGCDPVSNFTVQSRELAVRLRAAGADVTETYYPGARGTRCSTRSTGSECWPTSWTGSNPDNVRSPPR
jgi:acetyl esterase/lipase